MIINTFLKYKLKSQASDWSNVSSASKWTNRLIRSEFELGKKFDNLSPCPFKSDKI